MRRLPAILILSALSGCAAPPGKSFGPPADAVQYTVRRTQATKDQPSAFMIDAKLLTKGNVVQEPSLAIYDQKWATIKVGELVPLIQDLQVSPDEDDAVPSEVQIFSGTLLGFRCRDGSGGKIDVRVRIYEVRDGRLVTKITSNDILVSGETKTLVVPPSK